MITFGIGVSELTAGFSNLRGMVAAIVGNERPQAIQIGLHLRPVVLPPALRPSVARLRDLTVELGVRIRSQDRAWQVWSTTAAFQSCPRKSS